MTWWRRRQDEVQTLCTWAPEPWLVHDPSHPTTIHSVKSTTTPHWTHLSYKQERYEDGRHQMQCSKVYSSWPVYRTCAQVAPSGVNACQVKAHLIGWCWQNLGAVCFWQPIPSGLNLVVAAVLRDSLCVVSLLPCVADCCMLYNVCKVEQFVLAIIKQRLLLLLSRQDVSYRQFKQQQKTFLRVS